MDTEQFLTYQRFIDRNDAIELAGLLRSNSIDFQLEDHSSSFDASFANSELSKEYRIKLKKEDFDVADKIQLEIADRLTAETDKDHYLFGFSDHELIEVVLKRDEWSKFDFLLAQKILKDRGREITQDTLGILREQRLEELAKPEESQKGWITAGYLFALLGGLIGLFIGIHLLTHQKTLPNGSRVSGYSVKDKKHGLRITVIGLVFLVIWTGFRIFRNN